MYDRFFELLSFFRWFNFLNSFIIHDSPSMIAQRLSDGAQKERGRGAQEQSFSGEDNGPQDYTHTRAP